MRKGNQRRKQKKKKKRRKKEEKKKKKSLWGLLVLILLLGCLGSLLNKNKENESQQSIEETSTGEEQAATELKNEAVAHESRTVADVRQEIKSGSTEALAEKPPKEPAEVSAKISPINPADIPGNTGRAYVAINDNIPYFDDSELKTESFETYSNLDSLGRCGVAYANIGADLMPTEKKSLLVM